MNLCQYDLGSGPFLTESLPLHLSIQCLVAGVIVFCKRLFSSNRLEAYCGLGLCRKLFVPPKVSKQTHSILATCCAPVDLVPGILYWGFSVLPHVECALSQFRSLHKHRCGKEWTSALGLLVLCWLLVNIDWLGQWFIWPFSDLFSEM